MASESETEKAKMPGKNTLMGILAYIGPLVIISYIVGKDDPSVKFHIKQGLVLLVIEVIVWFVGGHLPYFLWFIVSLVNLAVLVLAILGIINAAQGKEKDLPLVGQFSKYFSF